MQNMHMQSLYKENRFEMTTMENENHKALDFLRRAAFIKLLHLIELATRKSTQTIRKLLKLLVRLDWLVSILMFLWGFAYMIRMYKR